MSAGNQTTTKGTDQKEAAKPQFMSWQDILSTPPEQNKDIKSTQQPTIEQPTPQIKNLTADQIENSLPNDNLNSVPGLSQNPDIIPYLKESIRTILYTSPSGIKLTKQEADLCAFYSIGDTQNNQRRSYARAYQVDIRADFSASSVFKKSEIRRRIAEISLELRETAELSPDIASKAETLAMITNTARASMNDFAEWGSVPASDVVKMIQEASQELREGEAAGRSIESIADALRMGLEPFVNYMRLKDSSRVDGRQVKSVKFTREGPQITLHDTSKAKEMLAKYHNLLGVEDQSREREGFNEWTLTDLNKLEQALTSETDLIKGLIDTPALSDRLKQGIPAVEQVD